MAPTKHWARWTEKTKAFPKNKYGFSEHLQRPGDYIVTGPLDFSARTKIIDAALFWAWTHQYTIKNRSIRVGEAEWKVRVDLIKLHRNRDYG